MNLLRLLTCPLKRLNVQRSTFNVQRSTFNVQRYLPPDLTPIPRLARRSIARALRASLLCLLCLPFPSRADIDAFFHPTIGADDAVFANADLPAATRGLGWSFVTNFTAGNTTVNQFRHTTSFGPPMIGFDWPITIGGTNFYGSNGAQGLRVYYTNSQRTYIRYGIPDTQKITFGFYFRLSAGWSTIDFNSQNFLAATCNNGDFHVLNLQNFSASGTGTNFLQIQTQLGTCESVGGANAETNVFSLYGDAHLGVTYWCAHKFDLTEGATGRSHIWFYDTNTWQRIATCVLDAASTASTRISRLEFGQYEPHGADQPAGTYTDFASLVIDTNGTQWPILPASKTRLAASTSSADFDTAYTAASAGDLLFLPKGSNLWTSTKSISKQLYLRGNGTNHNQTVINFDVAAQTDDGFYLTVDKSRVSSMQLRAVGNECRLIHADSANDCQFDRLYLHTAYWGLYNEGRNLTHSSTFLNLDKAVRNHGWLTDNSMWSTYYPIANASTNRAVFEDCTFKVTSAAIDTGTRNLCSSQNAGIWTFRHCTFEVTAYDWSPILDSHGDDAGAGLRGVLSDQIYKCDFIVSGTADVVGNIHDKRGGRGLCFSNTLAGAVETIRLREERESDVPNDRVEEYYFWNNDSDLSISIGAGNEDFIIQDAHYFLHSPSGDSVQLYPHYLRTGVYGAQLLEPIAPPNWSTARLGPGRATIKSRTIAPRSSGL